MKILLYVFICAGIVLLILAVTNPSQRDFEKYVGLQETQYLEKNIRCARIGYYGVYSVYEYKLAFEGRRTKYYYGIFGNFIEIK